MSKGIAISRQSTEYIWVAVFSSHNLKYNKKFKKMESDFYLKKS